MATVTSVQSPATVRETHPLMEPTNIGGFVFDPQHFPFTLTATLSQIAKKLRDLGLEKTGGKASDDPEKKRAAKYAYFEEAEVAAYLSTLFPEYGIGYAVSNFRVISNQVVGKTQNGGDMRSHEVQCGVMFTHKESKEWLIVSGIGEAFDSGDKGTQKAVTSAIKYVQMKTFLISEGGADIDDHQNVSTKGDGQSKNQTERPKQAENVKCHVSECGKFITPLAKDGKIVMTVQDYAKKCLEETGGGDPKKGFILCLQHLKEWRFAKQQPEEKRDTKGDTKSSPSTILVEGFLTGKPKARKIGADKKPVYDLAVKDGKKTIGITDWHKSHFEFYSEATGKEEVKIVVTPAKGNNNAQVKALMQFGEYLIEDEDGNKLSEETPEGYDEAVHGDAGSEEENPFAE